ncbi:phage tail protein [Burkholderia stagnalis]|uniref:phage tail protein n=1 Tax=Burkholderia stagnalis TaxID=1503054 RepID=UPI000F5644BE|nr:phage tail protein [Burkholderia stagnalis]RQQ49534.1 phage tail protein [Burkholderia stagnalis]RQY00417.1 phage tail protein [Burkholderia stagnalis]RQY15676.1 phage tail protein [Burkholderia stagnalis]RQY29804.1 phage tail protein [Burkholderia stagnalis]
MATQIIITDAGRAALVAPGNGGTSAHQVVEIGLANAPFVADKGLVKLPNELKRITTFGGANIAPDTIHATLKDDTADQYSLYGFGLYLENGVLLAAYGQATPIMEKSPAALLLLSTDMQFATIDATQLVFGDASFLNPPATTERQGVVELATQAEVNNGADDTRVLTPKTAASRYAALTGAKFTGPVVTEFDAGPDTAHVTVRPPSGKTGRESRVRLHGTFGGSNADTGTRLIATVRAGFDNGAWGREYVDLWLNKTANDPETDANQARAVRVTYGGRVLVGDVSDDGSNLLQVSGGAKFGWASAGYLAIDNGASWSTLYLKNGGKNRWTLGKSDADDFAVSAFSDDGTTQSRVLDISRTTQVANFTKRPTFAGATPWDSANLNPAQFVADAVLTALVGQIVFEPRTTVRAGFLKANGALVNRADYPRLWAYAQASGALVSEADWGKSRSGCFGMGDGATTFRLPELRGEFIRCWDDGRGVDGNREIGSLQNSANLSHAHGASASAGGDHVHSAWTDTQGWHGHHGWTAGVGDHQHVSPWGENSSAYAPPWGTWGGNDKRGSQGNDADNTWGMTSPAGNHNHEFNTDGAGNHGHNVGIGWAGNHAHNITVNADGASEARPRNVALLAMIRAY